MSDCHLTLISFFSREETVGGQDVFSHSQVLVDIVVVCFTVRTCVGILRRLFGRMNEGSGGKQHTCVSGRDELLQPGHSCIASGP